MGGGGGGGGVNGGGGGGVYKIPYRRARAWPSGCIAFRPSASREQRYLAYKGGGAPRYRGYIGGGGGNGPPEMGGSLGTMH